MSRRPFETIVRQLRQLVGSTPASELEDAALLDRFVRHGDEGAFATLVERYGPLVLSLCRRLLANAHDADDAFQATFLVLARRAGAIRKQRAVGSWLYGVAYRVALEARARAARRRFHERQAQAMTPSIEGDREVKPEAAHELLDAELQRLPEKYRTPLVLCYLEGKTNEQAARQLGCPTSSLSWRLGRARELLRQRLLRRGVALSAAGLAALLGESGQAAMSTALTASTAHAALLFTTGKAAEVSAEAAALSEGVLHAMRVTKLRLVAVLLVAIGLVGTGAGLALRAALAEPAPAEPAWAEAEKADEPRLKDVSDAQLDESVALGLRWLAKQQSDDGRWFLTDGQFPVAGTSLSLLPFLRAGETHKGKGAGAMHTKTVEKGLKFLLSKQAATGDIPDENVNSLYNHGLATLVLCEAYGRTSDPDLKQPAQRALDFIVKAQGPNGGWRYRPGQDGDTSVTGYQLEALEIGRRAGLTVPPLTWDRATVYLDKALRADGSYGYTIDVANPNSGNLTATGLLCRQFIGGKINQDAFEKGLKIVKGQPAGKGTSIYYLYRATRVMNGLESEATDWNRQVRAYLVSKQERAGADAGSWDAKGEAYSMIGRIGTTSFALLTLETALEPLPAPRDLKPEELEALWKVLAGDNMFQASQGILVLAVAPKQTVPFLEKHLRPVATGNQKAIDRWVADLGSNSFDSRQKAAEKLEEQGELAVGALERVLAGQPSLDLRQRIDRLLAKVDNTPLAVEQRQTLRSIRVLARIGTPEARRLLETLADGLEGARVTKEAAAALKRLAVKPAPTDGK
jgi:RNA polymerase sigma factor (sigma-70 family)